MINMEKFKEGSKKYRKVGPYILTRVIGRGAYSTVYEAHMEGQPNKYAVKQISLLSVNPKQLERIHSEIRVLSLIKHRNIVCLLDYKQTSRNLYLVFEFCKHTDLEAYTQKYCLNELPEEKVRKISIQIKNAFQVLRANKVVHRDLKLANILVTDEFDIKIADFGFAKLLDDDEYFKSYVGTPLTMAPEILENREYNQKCDLWSLGIVIYQLLFGKNPFFTKQRMTKGELKNAIRAELKIPASISPPAADLLRRLIVREPTERISFEEFFKHQWLTDQTIEDNLNSLLLEEALRVQVGKNLLSVAKKKEEKEFLLRHGEDLLAYEVIENVKNIVESKIMYWINLAKKIMNFENQNPRLVFFSLALLLENLRIFEASQMVVHINWLEKVKFPKYMGMRDLQKWEMSEYTKRLPGFIERSRKKIHSYMRVLTEGRNLFTPEDRGEKVAKIFLEELASEVEKKYTSGDIDDNLGVFLKVRPIGNFTNLSLKLTSPIFKDKALGLLLKKMNLNISNHRMYKRLHGVYKLEVLHTENPSDRIFENLKLVVNE